MYSRNLIDILEERFWTWAGFWNVKFESLILKITLKREVSFCFQEKNDHCKRTGKIGIKIKTLINNRLFKCNKMESWCATGFFFTIGIRLRSSPVIYTNKRVSTINTSQSLPCVWQGGLKVTIKGHCSLWCFFSDCLNDEFL